MKKMVIVLAILMLFTLSGERVAASVDISVIDTPFNDVAPNSQQASDFALLKTLGIIEGFDDGNVRPERALTRVEFAKVAVALHGEAEQAILLSANQPQFQDGGDIALVWWGWVNAVEHLNLMQGYKDGMFRPDRMITYGETLAVLLRTIGLRDSLEGLAYPEGYLSKAEDLGLTQGVNLQPSVPITRGEMARLAVNALLVDSPVGPESTTSPGIQNLLEKQDRIIKGAVTQTTAEDLWIDNQAHGLSENVFIDGVSTLSDLEGRSVLACRDGQGKIAFISVPTEVVSILSPLHLTGTLDSIDTAAGRLVLNDRPVFWDDDTRWFINAMERSVTVEILQDIAQRDDVDLQVIQLPDATAEEIRLLYFDVEGAVVIEVGSDIEDEWLRVDAVEDNKRMTASVHGSGAIDVIGFGNFSPQSISDFEPGDVLDIATIGGIGLQTENGIPSDQVIRIQFRRNRISGTIREVTVDEQADDLLIYFHLEDDQKVPVLRSRFSGGPRDMSLNDLQHARWVEFALFDDGYAARGLDALVDGAGARYVKILTAGELGDSYYVAVDQKGRSVSYELAFPGLWIHFIDQDLQVREGDFAQIEVNDSGKCTGVISWVANEPLSSGYMVSSVDLERQQVVLRILGSSSDGTRDPSLDFRYAVEPAVYDDAGDYLGLESLFVGQRVLVYLDDQGNVGRLGID